MSNVSFEEESVYQGPKQLAKKQGGFTNIVIQMGFAKDTKEAERFLLWSAVAGCVLALGLFTWMFIDRPQGLDEQDIERIIKLQQ